MTLLCSAWASQKQGVGDLVLHNEASRNSFDTCIYLPSKCFNVFFLCLVLANRSTRTHFTAHQRRPTFFFSALGARNRCSRLFEGWFADVMRFLAAAGTSMRTLVVTRSAGSKSVEISYLSGDLEREGRGASEETAEATFVFAARVL